MKFLVAKPDLKAALEVVSSAMASTGNDLSSHYLFRRPLDESMDTVEVLTHTGRMAARSQFVAAVEGTHPDKDKEIWAFTVEGWRLDMWLQSKGDEPLSLSYDHETKRVTAEADGLDKHKPLEWESLDPDNWLYWDDSLADSNVMSTISAARLKSALIQSKTFASSDENRAPEFCLCEVREGTMASSDKKGASLIYSDLWGKSNMRLHVRDVGGILAFLGKQGTDDVEILEHDRTAFFHCNNHFFVESRPLHVFPNFNHPAKYDQRWWVINVKSIQMGIKHLLSAAQEKIEPRLIFNRPDPDGPVLMTMKNNISDEANVVELDLIESGELDPEKAGKDVEPPPELPPEGFMVSRPRLEDILALLKDDDARIGVNRTATTGYLRFSEVKFADDTGSNGDTYTTVFSWIHK